MMRCLAAPGMLLASMLLSSSSLFAAPLKGTLVLPPAERQQPAAQGYWLLANDLLDVLPPLVDPRLEMVVLLEGTAAPASAAGEPTLVLEDFRITPAVVAVAPGTQVRFENKDPVLQLIEPLQSKFMPVKRLAPGSSEQHTFKKPGVYPLRCAEYPHMQAEVLVLSQPFARPNDRGQFTFAEVPNGSYTLKVWYRGGWIHSQPLTVQGRTTIEVSLDKLSEKE